VNEETQRFNAGELWWFDNKAMHHVKNATPIPRICMIFDAKGK
jgi:aspartyl/asparaginyl beta-hydroxylase (cupin superfamily)